MLLQMCYAGMSDASLICSLCHVGAHAEAAATQSTAKAGYRMAVPNGVRPDAAHTESTTAQQDDASDAASDAGSSGWETASDDEQDHTTQAAAAPATASSKPSAAGQLSDGAAYRHKAAADSVQPPATPSRGPESGAEASDTATSDKWEDWDLCCSLFDNHKSSSMEANLEYMLKNFGFYMPDAQYLSDPAGLLQYLVGQLCNCNSWICKYFTMALSAW